MQYTILKKPNRKTAKVIVAPDNSVSILAPDNLSDDEIDKIIQKKRLWILKKKALNNEVRKPAKSKEYVSGESFTYLGRNYRLKVLEGDYKPTSYESARLCVSVPKEANNAHKEEFIRESIINWYREHALTKFKQRAKKYSTLLNVKPKQIKLGNFKSQWGSCHQDKTVVFNWKVIMAPISIVDYVVAHELCHLIHHDHSKDFWRLLSKIMPDYAERKDWLRINGAYLEL
ncbi:hypothetical protein LNTAR_12116 [Lentisphaera araneosa HTCC2155]|uniref:YgjP-like metallopeptidase domain-containing protein n=1 Tax=Lentisphaera araneosa HTCC2155 TaxID=313628 RepID=A6DJM4_9BACT|nr:SprT family zinc-dependent metalloprotease [Lentisphaera araneosa]EDM28098.1 hypothetical protein LNTAR_12116 [Lentisphaera araneosa HTCC2155]